MLKTPRLVQLFRQAPLHAVVSRTPLKQSFTHQLPKLPSRSIPQRRGLATSSLRPSQLLQPWRSSLFRGVRRGRYNSNQAADSATKSRSLSERMKEMSKKYGWTVTGIYLGLSVLDFPFCFLAVKWFGTERIAEIEHAIVDGFWGLVEQVVPSLQERRREKEASAAEDVVAAAREAGDVVAEQAQHKDPGLGTQLLLAYGVHKSLIFFRIPITLAITPKVVKTLRQWGWKIGKPKVA